MENEGATDELLYERIR